MSRYTDALNDDAKFALQQYVGSAVDNDLVDEGNSDIVNGALRRGRRLLPDEEKQVALMDKAIQNSKIPSDTTVFRGGLDKDMEVGDAFNDKGFVSTSVSEAKATEFANAIKGGTRESPAGNNVFTKSKHRQALKVVTWKTLPTQANRRYCYRETVGFKLLV